MIGRIVVVAIGAFALLAFTLTGCGGNDWEWVENPRIARDTIGSDVAGLSFSLFSVKGVVRYTGSSRSEGVIVECQVYRGDTQVASTLDATSGIRPDSNFAFDAPLDIDYNHEPGDTAQCNVGSGF